MRYPATHAQARSTLTLVWAAGFLLLLAIPMALLAAGFIEADHTLLEWVDALCVAYVPQLGVILAYYFASKRRAGRQLTEGTPFYLALAVSIVWNVVMLGQAIPTLWGGANLDVVGTTMQALGSRLAWLTAPALGYFYGKSA